MNVGPFLFDCRRCPNCGSMDTLGKCGGYLDDLRSCQRCEYSYSPREECDKDAVARGEKPLFRRERL